MTRLLSCLGLLFLLTACGQSGALYLPEDRPASEGPPPPAVAQPAAVVEVPESPANEAPPPAVAHPKGAPSSSP